MNEWFDLFVVALLPLTALFTVLQTRPYAALISRGIMGVAAVMLYAVLGAADVALTEALVGTLLTVILYAITVRSTLTLRVGRLAGQDTLAAGHPLRQLGARFGLALRSRVFYTETDLVAALKEGRIDVMHAPAGRLAVALPGRVEKLPADGRVTVFARHGRWHMKKLQETAPDAEAVFRLPELLKEKGE